MVVLVLAQVQAVVRVALVLAEVQAVVVVDHLDLVDAVVPVMAVMAVVRLVLAQVQAGIHAAREKAAVFEGKDFRTEAVLLCGHVHLSSRGPIAGQHACPFPECRAGGKT
jgi:hypothetical protein